MQHNFPQPYGLSYLSRVRESQRRIPAMIIDNVMILDEADLGRVNRRHLRDESSRVEDVLDRLNARKYERSDEPETCCVCLEDYTEGQKLGALTCGHKFHAGCIARWLTRRNTCPICSRTALSSLPGQSFSR